MDKYQKLNDRITKAIQRMKDTFEYEATFEQKIIIAEVELECSRAIVELLTDERSKEN